MTVSNHNPVSTGFPSTRLRRNRKDAWNRRLVAENRLSVNDLIWPVFVHDKDVAREPVPSLPGVHRLSINALLSDAGEAMKAGIPLIAIFPVIDANLKSPRGEEALNPKNLVCRAVAAVKAAYPSLGVMTDVALDPFTDHGQDGLVKNGYVVNDETLEILSKQAVIQAEAGSDVLAPSDMMDGRVGAIRNALDSTGLIDIRILAYAAKYASTLYGPFRDAVGSASSLGSANKKTYQMDPANSDEALREVGLDISEGADMVMVKPGIFYLDILWRVKEAFSLPTFAYQVSGEYAMVKAAGEKGWLDPEAAMEESLLSLKRAGADAILSYSALDIARKLRERAPTDSAS